MKKSYSSWNLLKEQLSGEDNRGFFRYLFTNRKYITVKIPYIDYIRGKVFIQDLRDNFKEEVPFQFDFSILLYMLYDDYLTQIKRGVNPGHIADYLITGTKSYFPNKVKEKRIMKPLTKNIFAFETVEEEYIEPDEYVEPEEDKTAYLELRVKESEILRGEVLIHDLEPFLNGLQLSIEEMITIIYLDFIKSVKQDGNSLKVQRSILAHIKRF